MRRLGWGSVAPGALAVTVGLFLAPACSSNGSKTLASISQNCSLNSDCVSPLDCVFSRCHEACRTSSDCPAGERCIPSAVDGGAYNVCQLPVETTCTGSSCAGDLVCGHDDQCRAPCSTSASCIEGQTCASAEGLSACFDPANKQDQTVTGLPDGGGADAAPPGDGSSEADASSASDSLDGGLPFKISNLPMLMATGGGADGGDAGNSASASNGTFMVETGTCNGTGSTCPPASDDRRDR